MSKNTTSVALTFPETLLSKFEKKINFFQRKAVKLDLHQLNMRQINRFDQTAINDDGDPVGGVYRRFVTWEIQGLDIQPTGWTLIGFIKKGSPFNSINLIGDVDLPETQYTKLEADKNACDHCTKKRSLKETLLFINNETKVVRRVASKCLDTAFGSTREAASIKLWSDVLKWAEDDSYWDKTTTTTKDYCYDKHVVLSLTIVVVSLHGWKSRSEAYNHGGTSTSEMVRSLLGMDFNQFFATEDIKKIKIQATTPEVIGEVIEVLGWVEQLDPDISEYAETLKKSLSLPGVSIKDIGIACSAVTSYRRARDRAIEQNNFANSKWVGKVGDKFGRKLSTADRKNDVTAHPAIIAMVIFTKMVNSSYGVSTMVKFQTQDDDIFVWFKSGYEDFKLGDWYKIVATLKKQDDYNGIKQNTLTRCIVEKIPTPARV